MVNLRNFVPDCNISTKRGVFGLGTQSSLLTVLTLAAIVVVVVMAWALWKLLKTIEKLADRIDKSLQQFEMTAEDVRKTNAILQGVMPRRVRKTSNT